MTSSMPKQIFLMQFHFVFLSSEGGRNGFRQHSSSTRTAANIGSRAFRAFRCRSSPNPEPALIVQQILPTRKQTLWASAEEKVPA